MTEQEQEKENKEEEEEKEAEEKAENNPGNPGNPDGDLISPKLCEAYRNALDDKIVGLEDDIKKIDGRLWKTLAGVIVTILLTIIAIATDLMGA